MGYYQRHSDVVYGNMEETQDSGMAETVGRENGTYMQSKMCIVCVYVWYALCDSYSVIHVICLHSFHLLHACLSENP